jgi:hypothetical protein
VWHEQCSRTTRYFGATPQETLMDSMVMSPAEAFLNNDFWCYILRQMMMPKALGRGRMMRVEEPMECWL